MKKILVPVLFGLVIFALPQAAMACNYHAGLHPEHHEGGLAAASQGQSFSLSAKSSLTASSAVAGAYDNAAQEIQRPEKESWQDAVRRKFDTRR